VVGGDFFVYSTKLKYMNTTFERLIEIEDERTQTMGDPEFQQWMKELGVSIVYKDKDPIYKAKDLNSQYDFSRQSFVSIFK